MISRLPSIRSTLHVAMSFTVLLSLACADESRVPVVPTAPQFAKSPSGPAVSAATPPYGDQGQTGEQVTITGSCFAPGATVSWERNGVATTKSALRQLQYVSSTQLIATIDIAADADLAFYDVAVTNSDRKKGIGTELFEVTTALSLGALDGSTTAYGGNDNGEVVGVTLGATSHGFYWSDATGIRDLGGIEALGIDQAGQTIVGKGSAGPQVWTRSGTGWTSTNLPKDAAAVSGRAGGVGSDPITGLAVVIGGSEEFPVRRSTAQYPRLWKWTGTSWQKTDLPMPYASTAGTTAWVRGVNAQGEAVGMVNVGGQSVKAVVWEADGSYTVLGDGGAVAINRAGTLIAGSSDSGALYYTRSAVGDLWNGPFLLPGGCSNAMGVDDAGHLVARGCKVQGSTRVLSAAYAPPYASPVYLGGLGDVTNSGAAMGMSIGGTYIYGSAPTRPTTVAVRWRNPLF